MIANVLIPKSQDRLLCVKVGKVKRESFYEMTREKMIRTGYSNPQHDAYFFYFFDEEVTLGQFDIPAILAADREIYRQQAENDKKLDKNYPTGRPVYMTGRELMGYRIV